MRFGLPVSFFLHAGLIAWALVSFERAQPLRPPEPEPVEVAIISEDGLTRLRQGDRNSKNLEAAVRPPAPDTKALKEPPKPTPPPQAAAPPPPPPPPPEPAKPEPPKPDPIAEKLASLPPEPQGPTPEELARIEAQKKAEAEKKAAEEKKRRDELKRRQDEAKRLAELKKKQEEAKRKAAQQQQNDFDAEMQKALLDKAPPKPPTPGGAQVASASKVKGPVAGAPEGTDTVLTASQNALLGTLIKQAVSRCWNINAGAEGIDKVVVKLEVILRPDGHLAQPPKIVNSMPGPLFADTANSAVRAVVQCEPYNFPQELYKGGWESLVWTFDPRKMF